MKTHFSLVIGPIVMIILVVLNLVIQFRIDKSKAMAKEYMAKAQEALDNAKIFNEAVQPSKSLEFEAYVLGKLFQKYGGSNAVVFIFGDCGSQQTIATMTNHQVYLSYGRVEVSQHQLGKGSEL